MWMLIGFLACSSEAQILGVKQGKINCELKEIVEQTDKLQEGTAEYDSFKPRFDSLIAESKAIKAKRKKLSEAAQTEYLSAIDETMAKECAN